MATLTFKDINIPWGLKERASLLARSMGAERFTYEHIRAMCVHMANGKDACGINYVANKTFWSREKSAGYYVTMLQVILPYLVEREKSKALIFIVSVLKEQLAYIKKKNKLLSDYKANCYMGVNHYDLDFNPDSPDFNIELERELLLKKQEEFLESIDKALNSM